MREWRVGVTSGFVGVWVGKFGTGMLEDKLLEVFGDAPFDNVLSCISFTRLFERGVALPKSGYFIGRFNGVFTSMKLLSISAVDVP